MKSWFVAEKGLRKVLIEGNCRNEDFRVKDEGLPKLNREYKTKFGYMAQSPVLKACDNYLAGKCKFRNATQFYRRVMGKG